MKKRERLLHDYIHSSAKAQSYQKVHRYMLNHSRYRICTYAGFSKVSFCAGHHISGKRTFILNSALTPAMLPIIESSDFFTPVLAKEGLFRSICLGCMPACKVGVQHFPRLCAPSSHSADSPPA